MRERRGLVVAAVLGLALLVACRQEASGEPTLSITTPTEGDSITGPVRLAVSTGGAEIGPPETGNMHVHVYVDDSGEYEVVTSAETTVDVPDGAHALRVVLAQPNHDETAISDSVSVTVSGAAEPSPEADTGGGDTGGGGGGYSGGEGGYGGYG